MNYFENNALTIGNTPLVLLQKVVEKGPIVLAKLEGRNPMGSVKCRIGLSMVRDAEKSGVLKKGMTIIEPTSGNTGISLAAIGAACGYNVTITMPESMSVERRKILKFLGANVVLTDPVKGMAGAIAEAEKLIAENPKKFFMPSQFTNPANPAIHEETTGPEIWNGTEGKIKAFIAGIGTGGTITGVSRYIKKKMGKKIITVGIEPANSPVISQKLSGLTLTPGPHMIQGIGAGFIPEILDLSLIDRIEKVEDEEALEFAKRLAKEEGISGGISSGAAAAVAHRLSKDPSFRVEVIVVVFPDSGDKYISTLLFDL